MITGSYDKTVKIIDLDTLEETCFYQAVYPIECLKVSDSISPIIVVASSTSIVILDSNLKPISFNHNVHQKTITALEFSFDYKYLLSGSLDGHIKVFEVNGLSIKHNYTFSLHRSILSINSTKSSYDFTSFIDDDFLISYHEKHGRKNLSEYVIKGEFAPKRKRKTSEFDKNLQKGKYKICWQQIIESTDSSFAINSLEKIIREETCKVLSWDKELMKEIVYIFMTHISKPLLSSTILSFIEQILDKNIEVDQIGNIGPKFDQLDKLLSLIKKTKKNSLNILANL